MVVVSITSIYGHSMYNLYGIRYMWVASAQYPSAIAMENWVGEIVNAC